MKHDRHSTSGSLPRSVMAGGGYRLLKTGDVIRPTDEYHYGLPPFGWHRVTQHGRVGQVVLDGVGLPHRRRLPKRPRKCHNDKDVQPRERQ